MKYQLAEIKSQKEKTEKLAQKTQHQLKIKQQELEQSVKQNKQLNNEKETDEDELKMILQTVKQEADELKKEIYQTQILINQK